MGGAPSSSAGPLLHARPAAGGGGGAGFAPPFPPPPGAAPPSRSASGLGEPWLAGPSSRSPPAPPPPRWSAPERRAAVRGAACGAAVAAAVCALVALASSTRAAATAPAAHASFTTAGPGRLFATSGVGSEGRGHRGGVAAGGVKTLEQKNGAPAPVLISYAFFEKDAGQAANLDFFIAAGLGEAGVPGVAGGWPAEADSTGGRRADVVVTVSGPACSPCAGLARGLARLPIPPALGASITGAWGRQGLTLLHRAENEGMDLSAHNASLVWVEAAVAGAGGRGLGPATPPPPAASLAAAARATATRYGHAFFIFLNSSARGPFVPAYLPAGWHWTRAFTDGLARDGCGSEGDGTASPPAPCLPASEAPPAATAAALVAASLACLPPEDAGGPGPRAESWAFALSAGGLSAAEGARAFALRTCKLCADPGAGIVVGGEYGLSAAVLAGGQRLATLQARYARGVDWADPAHWGCNACAHASRSGTYGPGLALHPFETLFVKASWGVGAPYLEPYTAWATGHARGDDPGTGATPAPPPSPASPTLPPSPPPSAPAWAGPAACDLALYRYAVSPEATAPAAKAGVGACFLPPGLAGLMGGGAPAA